MTDRLTAELDSGTDPAGIQQTQYQILSGGQWSPVTGSVIEEAVVSIFANGQEIATVMATPKDREYLAVGYLYTEGLIGRREDIATVAVAPNGTCVDVLLTTGEITLPPRRILTSGCGRGVTYASYPEEMAEEEIPAPTAAQSPTFRVSPTALQSLVQAMQQACHLHQLAGGIHAAALASPDGLIVVMEDIGRHNTLDKIAGYCLMNEIEPAGQILLTTGRISSEMLNKALRMRLPLIASLTSPTSLAVERAARHNLTLVGYVRGRRMRVYTHPERVQQTGDFNEPPDDQD